MDMLNCRALKASAGERLSAAACDYKKLALIHTAAVLAVTLLISFLQFYLNRQMDSTGGLSGLGTRSVLTTIQMVLQYGVNIALPFWEIGFIYTALRMARKMPAETRDLTTGFRRFGPVLRLYIIREMLFTGVGVASVYVAAFIYSFTPLSAAMTELVMPMLSEGADLEQVQNALLAMPVEELLPMFLPFLILAGALFAVLALCLHYRFRVAEFIIMDQPGAGALMALAGSSRMTKHHRMKLLRLDLSFWWFYGLVALSALVMYADALLPYLSVELPFSGDIAWFVSLLAGGLIQLVVYWQFYGFVQTTYATAYEVLLQKQEEPPKPQPAPKNLPWNDYYEQQ